MKDPYVFDFIPFREDMLERDIEQALVRDVKRSNENPSIGIILCPEADRVVVEYATIQETGLSNLPETMLRDLVAKYLVR